jgi:hypothetical protein
VQQAFGEEKDGKTSFFLNKYQTRVEYVAGLMPPGVQGVNHGIAIDGLTAILTVTLDGKRGEAKPLPVSTATFAVRVNPDPAPVAAVQLPPPAMENSAATAETSRSNSATQPKLASRQSIDLKSKTKDVWTRLKTVSVPKYTPVAAAEPKSKPKSETTHPATTTVDSSVTAVQPPEMQKTFGASDAVTPAPTANPVAAVAA